MGVKKLKPTSPGRRFQTVSDFESVTKDKPEKSLLAKKTSKAGRNSYGRITSRHRGGGHKQRYRIVDFRRNKDGVPATVASIEYDPNRNARIALLHYHDGEKRYILSPVGSRLVTLSNPDPVLKSDPVTHFLCAISRRVPRSTQWSCDPAVVPRWAGLPGLLSS